MTGDRRHDTSPSGAEDVPPWDRRAFGTDPASAGEPPAWETGAESGPRTPLVWTEPEHLTDQSQDVTGGGWSDPRPARPAGHETPGHHVRGEFLSGGLPADEPRGTPVAPFPSSSVADPYPSGAQSSAGFSSSAEDLQQLTVLGHGDRSTRRRGPLLAMAAGAVAMILAAAAGGWVWARNGLDPTAPTSSSAGQPIPGGRLIAADYFERTASSGFGEASLGGTWKLLARTKDERSHYKVDQGRANLEIDKGVRCTAYLPKASSISSDVLTSFATDTQPTAGGLYVGLLTRATGVSHGLLTDVFIQRDDSVRVRLQKVVGAGKGDVATLENTTKTLTGTLPRDAVVYVRTQTVGTAPTILRTKVWWGERSAEPADWSSSARIDGDQDFREPGSVALTGYLSKEAATASVNVSVFAVEGWDITG